MSTKKTSNHLTEQEARRIAQEKANIWYQPRYVVELNGSFHITAIPANLKIVAACKPQGV